MDRPRMRPRFELELGPEHADLFERLRQALRRPESPCWGLVSGRHAALHVQKDEEKMFSPILVLDAEEREDAAPGLKLRGFFGPHPHVWTGFMAIYGVLGLCGFFGAIIGLGQWTAQETPWMLLAAPISIALIAFTYGAAFIGQGLSAEQMYVLRRFLDEVIEPGSGERASASGALGIPEHPDAQG